MVWERNSSGWQSATSFARTTSAVEASRLVSGVYGWMAAGVAVTTVTSIAVAFSGVLEAVLQTSPRASMFGIFLLQIGLVVALSHFASRMSIGVVRSLFLLYSAITGLSVGTIFFVFSLQSILSIFALSVAGFIALAAFGLTTKRSLGFLGTFLFMGLFMAVGLAIVNIFVASSMLSYVGNWIALLVFSGLTAYESQRIREAATQVSYSGGALAQQFVIQGALSMYLNFINMFLSMLNLFGGRRS